MTKLNNTIIRLAITGLIILPVIAISTVQAQPDQTRNLPVETFKIKLTEQVIEMPDVKAKVTPHAVISRAEVLRSVLLAIDPEMELTRFRPEFKAADTLRINRSGKTIRRKDWSKVYTIRLSKEINFFEIQEQVKELESVEWVSPPVQIKMLEVPDDLNGEGTQWNIPKVQGLKAWNITQGDADIRIQIMDNGIPDHDDIDNKVVTTNLYSNGYHGLQVAGVAGAETDNGDGIASLGWETSLLDASLADPSVVDFDERVAGYFEASFDDESDLFEEYHSDIINCSFFTTTCYQVNQFGQCIDWESTNFPLVEDVVDDALNNDVIIVAAAGNIEDPNSRDSFPYTIWPAAYDGVISVSASNSSDNFPSGYNYGSFVNLSAPAIDILTLDQNDGYSTPDGTSFASPLVAATVALMKNVDPSLTPTQAASILESTADKVGQYSYSGGWNQYMGHGRLNAYEAVKYALPLQYTSETFSSSGVLANSTHLYGSNTIGSGVTVGISGDDVVVLSGTLSGNNSTLDVYNGRLIIEESADISGVNIDVGSGGELIIREGATLSFGSGQGIVADGPVHLNGSSSDPIMLEASGGSAWDGVHLYGTGADNSVFTNVSIDGASIGLGIYNAQQFGLSNNISVTNSEEDGILLSSSDVLLASIEADGNNDAGIMVDGGDVGVILSSISQNGLEGVFADGGASVDGLNAILLDGNTSASLRLKGSSYMQMTSSASVNLVGGAYHALAADNSDLVAEDNWWDDDPPASGKFSASGGSTIDYTPWLSFYPLPFSKTTAGPVAASQTAGSEQTEPDVEGAITSVGKFRAFLKQYPRQERLQAMASSAYRLPASLHPWLDILEIEYLQKEGDYNQAEQLAQAVMEDQNQSLSLRTTAARRLFIQQLMETKNPEAARQTLNWIAEITPKEEQVHLDWMETVFRIFSEEEAGIQECIDCLAGTTAEENSTELSNYPNPFNPVTTIRYSVPEQSQVILQVYDQLGREVATLVSGEQAAGAYSVPFDASQLSSGIYLYRLRVGNTTTSGRMTLVK